MYVGQVSELQMPVFKGSFEKILSTLKRLREI